MLAWSRCVQHASERQFEIERFFRSAEGDARNAIDALAKYGVTHVIEHSDRDAIHPDVIRRLQPILLVGGVRLYAVGPLRPAAG